MDFSSVIGHETVLKLIKDCMEKAKFSGAYIFSGPEAIGKKMVAQIIARTLNSAASIQHADIHLIEHGQSQVKIEDVRELQRQANLRPYEGKMNIFIIDNAHKLNPDAANSLLKILEEPPKDALIILITHKPQNIIKTVASRCKKIKFSPLPRKKLEDILVKNYSLNRNRAHLLSFYAEGRMGLALKLQDNRLLSDKNRIFDSFVLSGKDSGYLTGQSKEEIHDFLNILASWFRDIYIIKAGLSEQQAIHADRKDDLLRQAERFSFKQLEDMIALISDSLLYLERNINSKLLLQNLGAELWKA